MLSDIDALSVLEGFIADEVIDEVVGLVKSGKEAVVYLARKRPAEAGPHLFAAKIYKDTTHRSFRDDSTYRAGRFILDARTRRAVAAGTRHGKRASFGMWIEAEREALERLHQAGADVPRLFGARGNVILMEYIGDEAGPAPMLRKVRLKRKEAARAFQRVVGNLAIFLEVGIVHADLSPYNILYWDREITIIDFPQAVDLYKNPNAPELFARDVRNVCEFFARFGVRCSTRGMLRHFEDFLPRRLVLG
jgi:RIO kinase 1